MRRVLVLSFALAALTPLRAQALTVRDVVELARAGLGDEILLALIEVDRTVFPIDTDTLKKLKAAGVGERVILAMIRSARIRPSVDVPLEVPSGGIAEQASAPPPPQVIVIDHREESRVREVFVPVPVYVPVVRRVRPGADHVRSAHDDLYVDPRRGPHPLPKAPEPVYWGWGGKLRPDAWKPR